MPQGWENGMGRALVSLLLVAASAVAADIEEREPGPKATGKVYTWHARDGLAYNYYVPKGYDPEKGANLTIILHGSNLTRGWGFANHAAGEFRPDDIVVAPDGTTPNGQGGFNFLDNRRDLARLHALHMDLKERFAIRQTFLYGHSQGSFFAFVYAGTYPEAVDGVVGHASGVWAGTPQGKQGHHQAIVLMHGTQDPVVPYVQSVGGLQSFLDARYPHVRLRSLEGWNHWPAEHNGPVRNTSQQLAWCEALTTKDSGRLETCFDFLAKVESREWHDYAALFGVAQRVLALQEAPEPLRRRADTTARAVEALAAAHVAALPPAPLGSFESGPWVGHLPAFLRTFRGVPACDALAADWEKLRARHEKDAGARFAVYWRALQRDKAADAFEAGLEAVRQGFLDVRCADRQFLERMRGWREDARKLRLSRKAMRDYDALLPDFERALEKGLRAFEATNRKAAVD